MKLLKIYDLPLELHNKKSLALFISSNLKAIKYDEKSPLYDYEKCLDILLEKSRNGTNISKDRKMQLRYFALVIMEYGGFIEKVKKERKKTIREKIDEYFKYKKY